MSLPTPIDELPNLGPASAGWLREAGISTVADLQRLGPVVAYRLVKARRPQASLNLLWALAAGHDGLDWRALPDSDKDRLRTELDGG
jgi:DNA transformation protein and related proteins